MLGLFIVFLFFAFIIFGIWYIGMKSSGVPAPVMSLLVSDKAPVQQALPVATATQKTTKDEILENKEIQALLLELLEERKAGYMPGDITSGRFTIRESKAGGVFIKENNQMHKAIVKQAHKFLKKYEELAVTADALSQAFTPQPTQEALESYPSLFLPLADEQPEEDFVLCDQPIPSKMVPVLRDALNFASTDKDKQILVGLVCGVNESEFSDWLSRQSALPDWAVTNLDVDLLYLGQKVFGKEKLPYAFQKNLPLFRLVGREIRRIHDEKGHGPIIATK